MIEPSALESQDAPSTMRVKRLQKEVVPFGPWEILQGKVPYVSNPDPILAYVALKDEEEYQTMERAEPQVFACKKKRLNTLFSYGTEIAPANNSKDALDLKDLAVHMLKGIDRWNTVQRLMMDGVFWGWRPLECMYRFDLDWRGKPYWAPKVIHEKKPQQFRFTPNRELVYVGKGLQNPIVFNRWEDELHWLICTSGSTDNPYGEALYRSIWLIYHVKNQAFQKWMQGMGRSVGLVKAKQTANIGAVIDGSDAAKTISEIANEVRTVLQEMDQKGVLIEKSGWTLDVLSDIEFSEGWKMPVSYCDELINIAMTGETLSMKLGDVGSRAAAQVHRDGLMDYCKGDAYALSEWVNDELIAPFLTLAFGDIPLDLMPKFQSKIHQEANVDRANVLFNMGAPIDGERLAAETGVPLALDDSPSRVVLKKPDPLEMLEAQTEAKLAVGGGAPPGKKPDDPDVKKGKNPPAKKSVGDDQGSLF